LSNQAIEQILLGTASVDISLLTMHDPKQLHDVLQKDNAQHAATLPILSTKEVSLNMALLPSLLSGNGENLMISFATHLQMA
jgi:hypothetical protein